MLALYKSTKTLRSVVLRRNSVGLFLLTEPSGHVTEQWWFSITFYSPAKIKVFY